MSLPVILRPAADSDIQKIHDDLEQVRAGLGNRFVARVKEVLARIEFMPEMYGVVWQDVRAARLRRFRHVVYYVVFADRVEVLAVLHGAQDAPAWQTRSCAGQPIGSVCQSSAAASGQSANDGPDGIGAFSEPGP
jgi:plasmid stabilization system protein ParE